MTMHEKLKAAVNNLYISRKGLGCINTRKKKSNIKKLINPSAAAVIGMIIQLEGTEPGLTIDNALDLISKATEHEYKSLPTGRVVFFEEIIDKEITSNPWYEALEYFLMKHRPGNAQVGPGEFFLCFFGKNTVFDQTANKGSDVIIDGVVYELKSDGSNFTGAAAKFDEYAAGVTDRLMFIRCVSDADKPRSRSAFFITDLNTQQWRDHTYFKGAEIVCEPLRDGIDALWKEYRKFIV